MMTVITSIGISRETLNKMQLAGRSHCCLQVKVAAPIVSPQDLHRESGFMNGTRLIVVDFESRVIEALIVTGSHEGQIVLTLRLILTSSDDPQPVGGGNLLLF